MAKWFGKIGYEASKEIAPGVWSEEPVEHEYYGEVLRNSRRLHSNGEINDGVNISNQLSIIADPFATENFQSMRYAVYMGQKWKITDVEVQFPRLILTLGGKYNG